MPSLVKCYKHNKNACCNAGQDAYIESTMGAFFPESCQRSFDEIQRYFCFGCNNREPQQTLIKNETVRINNTFSVTVTKKYLYLCEGFVASLWGGNVNKSTTRFDSCGMTSYWKSESQSSDVILPSLYFKNAAEFLSAVKPPLFEDYEIKIIPDNTS